MKKYIIIISLLFASYTTFSQGYMGHKFGIRYNGLFSPKLSLMYDDNPDSDVGINYTHSFSLSYTLNKATEIFVEFEIFNIDYSIELDSTGYSEYYGTINYNYYEATTIKSKSFGLGFRFYSTDWLAPLGLYNQLSFLISSAKAVTKDYREEVVEETVYPRIGWGMGSQRVIAGNLMVDIGLQTYLSFVNPFDDNTIQQRLFFRNMFSFKLGLTYVL